MDKMFKYLTCLKIRSDLRDFFEEDNMTKGGQNSRY